jgi:hypothetical protein
VDRSRLHAAAAACLVASGLFVGSACSAVAFGDTGPEPGNSRDQHSDGGGDPGGPNRGRTSDGAENSGNKGPKGTSRAKADPGRDVTETPVGSCRPRPTVPRTPSRRTRPKIQVANLLHRHGKSHHHCHVRSSAPVSLRVSHHHHHRPPAVAVVVAANSPSSIRHRRRISSFPTNCSWVSRPNPEWSAPSRVPQAQSSEPARWPHRWPFRWYRCPRFRGSASAARAARRRLEFRARRTR